MEFAGLIQRSDQSSTDERLNNQAWTHKNGQIDDGPDSNLSDPCTTPKVDTSIFDHGSMISGI